MAHEGPTTWLLNFPLPLHDPRFIHVNGSLLVFLGITIVSMVANRLIVKDMDRHLVPNPKFTLVSVVDVAIEGLYNMVTGTLGETGAKYFPFIAAIFLFVFFNNFLGLIPFAMAPTGSVNTTLALGLSAFVYYNVMGIREHGLIGYLNHFTMGLGLLGILLIAPLEIFSQLIRPFSLAIRLFVNMHVDHTLLKSFESLFIWLLPAPLLIMGVVVATIQAFVFAILTAVYVQMATEHEEH